MKVTPAARIVCVVGLIVMVLAFMANNWPLFFGALIGSNVIASILNSRPAA